MVEIYETGVYHKDCICLECEFNGGEVEDDKVYCQYHNFDVPNDIILCLDVRFTKYRVHIPKKPIRNEGDEMPTIIVQESIPIKLENDMIFYRYDTKNSGYEVWSEYFAYLSRDYLYEDTYCLFDKSHKFLQAWYICRDQIEDGIVIILYKAGNVIGTWGIEYHG